MLNCFAQRCECLMVSKDFECSSMLQHSAAFQQRKLHWCLNHNNVFLIVIDFHAAPEIWSLGHVFVGWQEFHFVEFLSILWILLVMPRDGRMQYDNHSVLWLKERQRKVHRSIGIVILRYWNDIVTYKILLSRRDS